jgi:Domain of unknown function (DUF4157)
MSFAFARKAGVSRDSQRSARRSAPNAVTRTAQPVFNCPCGGICPKCRVGSDNPMAMVHETLRCRGEPLEPTTQTEMSRRTGQDLSQVRVHTDERAAASARAMDAIAYTVGRHVVFGGGMYRPCTGEGQRLLAHELAHVIQQGGDRVLQTNVPLRLRAGTRTDVAEYEANMASEDIVRGRPLRLSRRANLAGSIQRQTFHTPSISVRSPVFEETVTQLTELMPGRSLTQRERELASGIFGTSIDYPRVRLIPTSVLEYRTVANSIRVPENFTVANTDMAQTLIHELTHVWQYQHSGTSYLSISLGTQIAAQVGRGNRNFAYDYQIRARQTFFDFTPEQQAFMVENYFAMQRDQAQIPRDQAAGRAVTYNSVHFGSDGFPTLLSAADRETEIARELPLHEPLIQQMRTAMPRQETSLLLMRASEVMQVPGAMLAPVSGELELAPTRPLLEVRFPGL